MRPRYRVSRAAIDLIKGFEGYRRQAAQLPDGRWTIGHGHTLTARQGAVVSEDDAEALLLYDLITVAHVVNETIFAPLTQSQFDALVSFAFNIGLDSFRRSQVLKRLNEGDVIQAACAMDLWRAAEMGGERIVVDALVRRRAAEKALFLSPPVAAPSPVLRPVVDLDALRLIPAVPPATLTASLDGDVAEMNLEGEAAPLGSPVEVAPAGAAVQAAAEAVTERLQSIFPDPGEPGTPAAEARPQADFAPPIAMPAAEPEPEPEPDAPEPTAESVAQAESPPVMVPPAVANFIPARRPPRRVRRTGWSAYAVLGVLGLALFGFAIFWGLNARNQPGSADSPMVVAGAAGLIGVALVVVAVFQLLEQLSRAADRD